MARVLGNAAGDGGQEVDRDQSDGENFGSRFWRDEYKPQGKVGPNSVVKTVIWARR